MINCGREGGVFILDGRRVLRLLGQQNECLYAKDHRGGLWYRILPRGDGKGFWKAGGDWHPVAGH